MCECNEVEARLDQEIRSFFTTESFGMMPLDKLLESKEIERARELMKSTTRKIGEQYETGLLRKRDGIVMPNNRQMAIRRLICFENKLLREQTLSETVRAKMASHIQNVEIFR